VTWYARYTDRAGRRRSAGTYPLRREAQEAIDRAYGRSEDADTVRQYLRVWLTRHPRSRQTADCYRRRVGRVLEVPIDRTPLGDWPMAELRRRHGLELVDHLLRKQRRSAKGASGILAVLSAMAEDAITDELIELNVWRGVRVKASDPRITKAPREMRVWAFEQMHEFAAAAGRVRTTKTVDRRGRRLPVRRSAIDPWRAVYAEPMVRTFADTGMRLGEVLPLERADLADGLFQVRRTVYEGVVESGTKTDHGEQNSGRLAPCPRGLGVLIGSMPSRIDTGLLFPTPTGKLWRERNFYRDVWYPAQRESGMDIRPHEMRHSWITHLRARGIDDADLAEMAGHTLQTMIGHYTHALNASYDAVCSAIG
jgi:integrase